MDWTGGALREFYILSNKFKNFGLRVLNSQRVMSLSWKILELKWVENEWNSVINHHLLISYIFQTIKVWGLHIDGGIQIPNVFLSFND